MDSASADWLSGSFSCLPSWRWARARWLHARVRPASARIDDDWVERALCFLRAGGDTAPDAARRRSPDPTISAALALSREEPPHRRWELEARLLTDVPVDAVARRC